MNNRFECESFETLLKTLQDQPCVDDVAAFPSSQLQAMQAAGVFDWDLPPEFGGCDLQAADLLDGLRLLAQACLTSTFVLTQRSAAVRRIITSTNQEAQKRLLPALHEGSIFATVGISHLTTSGQHLRAPLVEATETANGFTLNGLVPWATGVPQADILVTGGQLEDGRQILAAVPTDRSGLDVQPPVSLLALNASQTGAVRLNHVEVSADEVLHGPVEGVMSSGSGGGAGSLGTSALAIGMAQGALKHFAVELQRRPELNEFFEPLDLEAEELTTEMRLAATGKHDAENCMETIRRRANSLAMRVAQAWLAATKGAGYVSGHPAERAVRESMFFLVWSCPQPVLQANLQELSCSR